MINNHIIILYDLIVRNFLLDYFFWTGPVSL